MRPFITQRATFGSADLTPIWPPDGDVPEQARLSRKRDRLLPAFRCSSEFMTSVNLKYVRVYYGKNVCLRYGHESYTVKLGTVNPRLIVLKAWRVKPYRLLNVHPILPYSFASLFLFCFT